MLVLMLSVGASAQGTNTAWQQIKSNTVLANGTGDTSSTFSMVGVKECEIAFVPTEDTTSVKMVVSYGANGVWNTSTATGDTLTQVTKLFKGWVIKEGTTNRVPGASDCRIFITGLGSGNGVTTPGYKLYVKRIYY